MATKNISPINPEGQPKSKFCYGCNSEKDVDVFYKNKLKKDGLQTRCIQCAKDYEQVNEDRLRQRRKEYNEKYRERIRIYKKAHYDKEAKREYNKRYYHENFSSIQECKKRYRIEKQDPVAAKQYRKAYYEANKVVLLAKHKEYRRINKKALSEAKKRYQATPEAKALANKWHRKRRKNDPAFRLNCNISAKVSKSLQESREGCHWEDLVGYTLKDLKKHLQKQFTEGMSWENYGEWHVDHKIPLAVHNFTTPEHLDFKKAWALKNLQPLWAHDNHSKKASIDKPFQPTLQLTQG